MKTLEITTSKNDTDLSAEQLEAHDAFACQYLQEKLECESVEIVYGGNGLGAVFAVDGKEVLRDSHEHAHLSRWLDKAFHAWIAQ